jgi:UDP-N-acetylglucosamine enolpyruvyl transferase
MMDLYDQLKETGAELDNHESDLYVLQTPETLTIVQASGMTYSTFVSQIDQKVWIDVPFAHMPWWRARTG